MTMNLPTFTPVRVQRTRAERRRHRRRTWLRLWLCRACLLLLAASLLWHLWFLGHLLFPDVFLPLEAPLVRHFSP